MVVYIEVLILDNFFLTYFISSLTYTVTGHKKSGKRAFIVSLLSTAVSFLYLYCIERVWLAYLIKALSWLVFSLILYLKKQKILSSALVFLLNTLLIGGVITFINTLFAHNLTSLRSDFSFPFGLIVFLGYVITFIIKRVHISISKTRTPPHLVYAIKTSINGVAFNLKGFLDTGNRLADDNGLPVIIVKVSSIIKGFSPATFSALIEKGRAHYLSYATVTGGVNKIMLIYPDFFLVEGEKETKEVALGVSFSGFYGDYDMILHPNIINGSVTPVG